MYKRQRLDRRGLAAYRQSVQMIFQDPYASLNPRHTVNDILESALRIHHVTDRQERRRRIAHMLDAVGLPHGALARYPSEFSGGQRQRIGIARALVCLLYTSTPRSCNSGTTRSTKSA